MKNNWVIWTALVLATIIVAAVALHSPKFGMSDEGTMSRLPEAPDQTSASHLELEEKFNSTLSLLNVPIGGFHQNFVRLKAGETGEIYYTFYSRNGGPANVSYEIYRVNGVYETEPVAMPDGLDVSIAPSSFIGEPHQNYTSKITITTSPELLQHGDRTAAITTYTLYLQADFEGENETDGNDWIRVLVEGDVIAPGASGLYQPYGCLANETIGFDDKTMILKAGTVGSAYYTLHTIGGGIGKVSYQVYRIRDITHKYPVPDKEKLPMPEGLSVSIEPNNFIARNFEDYTSKITVRTASELARGEYILCIDVATSGMLTNDLLIINVI